MARRRLTGLLAGVLAVAGLFSLAIGLGKANGLSFAELFRGPDKAPPHEFPVLAPSPPLRIAIPDIGVRTGVHAVNLDRTGSIDVPAANVRNETGWYEQGPTPGQFGPAIIVGHVDSRDKPAVFARLNELKPGAKVEVTRRDRTVAIFEVNSVERFSKDQLPVDRVYNDFSRPSLRLITCGGRWVGGDVGYADNIIVFASLTSTKKA